MAAKFIYTYDTGDSWEHQIVELKAPLKPGDEDRSDPLSDIRNANFAIASTSIHLWHDVHGRGGGKDSPRARPTGAVAPVRARWCCARRRPCCTAWPPAVTSGVSVCP